MLHTYKKDLSCTKGHAHYLHELMQTQAELIAPVILASTLVCIQARHPLEPLNSSHLGGCAHACTELAPGLRALLKVVARGKEASMLWPNL